MIYFFSLDKVSPKAAVFDETKLEWMNGLYLRQCSVDKILGDVVEEWKKMGIIDDSSDESYLKNIVRLLKDRSKRIKEIAENATYFFIDPQEYDPKSAKKNIELNRFEDTGK